MAAHLRNETESTRPVAAFRNLDEGVVTWRGQHSRRRFVVEISRALIAERNHRQRSHVGLRIADAQVVIDLTGADKSIDLGHRGFQLISIAFNQAAGHYQALSFAGSL